MLNRYVSLTFFAIIASSSAYIFIKMVKRDHLNYYSLVFNESISGLMIGSSVLIKGVKIGIVTGVNLMEDEVDKAIVMIKTIPLKESDRLEAKLALANFMGHSVIDLYYVNLSYVLPKIKGHTQIRVADSMMKKIQNTIEDLVNERNLAQIGESGQNALVFFNKAIENLGYGIEKGITFLNSTNKLSEQLGEFLEELKITRGKIDKTLDSLSSILDNKNVRNFLEKSLVDTSKSVDHIKEITGNLTRDLAEFEKAPINFLLHGKQKKTYKIQVKPKG